MPVYTYTGSTGPGRRSPVNAPRRTRPNCRHYCAASRSRSARCRRRARSSTFPTFGGGVKAKELAIFTRQFSVMIDAGLPLVQCLEILAQQQENKTFQKVLTGVRASVEGGATLSASMKQHEKVFDPLYYNMVEAGETGGILDTILQRLSTYIEKNVKLKRAVKSAMIYPVAVIGIAARRDHAVAVEGGADFRHVVRGIGRGSASANANRHRVEQLRGQLLRIADCGGACRRRNRTESLVRHAARSIRH